MPGAPAATQTRTASHTDGIDPPRELRMVATLLTLTESLGPVGPWRLVALIGGQVSDRGAEMLSGDVDDFLAPLANLAFVLPLEHHAQERLGAGVAHEETARAFQPLLD
jgi:hypothetical protein